MNDDELTIDLTKDQMKKLAPVFNLAMDDYLKNPKRRGSILMQPFEGGYAKIGYLPNFYAKKLYKLVEQANKNKKKKGGKI